MNQQNIGAQAQLVAQWITSLAISVICCAILFVVFAGYMVELHNTINLATVRLEVLQDKNTQMNAEIAFLKRQMIAQAPVIGAGPQQPAAQQPMAEQPPASGVEIPEPAPPEPEAANKAAPEKPATVVKPPKQPAAPGAPGQAPAAPPVQP